MTALATIQDSIHPALEALNARIMQQLSTDNPLMDTVVSSYLKAKGKQIRPIIVILCAKMFGSVTEKTLDAAAAVELLHNASLIHDDVVDNSKMRRNAPTINSVWDNHIAVLVGDFFVSSAMQRAIATGDVRIIDSLCFLGKQLSLGELDQIYNARYHKLTEEAYFRIISYKTASLFVACGKMGCYSVGVDDERVEKISRFTELLGQCFQIRDDIFDYFESENVGKPTGNDLREGKITLPLLHVLTREELPGHDSMLALSQKGQLTDAEIETLMAYARDMGGIEYAVERMRQLRALAAGILADLPDNDASAALLSIFDYIIDRDF